MAITAMSMGAAIVLSVRIVLELSYGASSAGIRARYGSNRRRLDLFIRSGLRLCRRPDRNRRGRSNTAQRMIEGQETTANHLQGFVGRGDRGQQAAQHGAWWDLNFDPPEAYRCGGLGGGRQRLHLLEIYNPIMILRNWFLHPVWPAMLRRPASNLDKPLIWWTGLICLKFTAEPLCGHI